MSLSSTAHPNCRAIASAFTEIESGRRHTNRPQLQAALAHCRKSGATLLIARLDRLARNVAFIAGLMESGVDFLAVDMPTANRLTIHILTAVAEHEREMISQRTKAALAQAKARGKKLGNPRPLEALKLTNAAKATEKPAQHVLDLMTGWPGPGGKGCVKTHRNSTRRRRCWATATPVLQRLQREALPNLPPIVLDWWHIAVRFEHALQTARGLGTTDLPKLRSRRGGSWIGAREMAPVARALAGMPAQTRGSPPLGTAVLPMLCGTAGIERLKRHASELAGYLERNEGALVHYAARDRRGEVVSTAFAESSVNEIIAKRMNKKQQMRRNRATVQAFLNVRTAVLNDTLEDAFRRCYPGFRPANDDDTISLVA